MCFGHFGSGSYSAPRTDKWILELTDNSVGMMTHSKWLPLVARLVAPHPARFHRVWSVQTGTRPIFFWQPVPPSDDYVALGMIATDTEEPPSPRLARERAVPSSAPRHRTRRGTLTLLLRA